MFNCELCSFETSHKSNYTAHIKTKRHLTKIEITSENPPKTSEKIYSCNFCNNEYTRLDNLNRHQKCCVKQIIEDKNNQLEINNKEFENKLNEFKLIIKSNDKLVYNLKKEKNSEIKELKTEIKKLKEEKDSEIKELKQKNEELNNTIHEINNKQISVLQTNLKPSNNNNTQIIINNYPNAPNIGFPENIQTGEELNKYIDLGAAKGLGQFIYDNWAKDIEHVDRSIWMVDQSRNKFLIRMNNAWVIDLDGKQFQELNIIRIREIFYDYLQTFNQSSNDYDPSHHVKTMEFINDIKTKNMIVKGLKECGKYLVYDKEKYIVDQSLENESLPEIIPETITKI